MTSNPATAALPPSGRISVARILTAVVLPAPFGPSSPHTAPAGTWRSKPSRALVFPYRFASPSARTAADLVSSPITRLLRTAYAVDPGMIPYAVRGIQGIARPAGESPGYGA